MVARSKDILAQYEAVAPLDGVITNLPVRVGETVVQTLHVRVSHPHRDTEQHDHRGELLQQVVEDERHEDDEAVGRAAFRMLVGSGFADYEIWRDDEPTSRSEKHDRETRHRILKSAFPLGGQ